MPRYFFHIRNDVTVDDMEGTELRGEAEARQLAIDCARELVCVGIHDYGGVNLDHYINVTNNADDSAFNVTFREAFTITG